MTQHTPDDNSVPRGANRHFFLALAGPVIYEAAKTLLLLVLMFLSVWSVLEIFRAGCATGPWPERLWKTFSESGLDTNGLPIAARFFAAARHSLAIVLPAAVMLAIGSLALGYSFALRPAFSVLRLPVLLLSAVPAFVFPFLGVPLESAWFWPAACLALGDLNAGTMVAHCYHGIGRELNLPYVRTARSQGLSVWSDLWPRAVLIAIEGVRSRIPHLLGGTVAIEHVFNIHGLGDMALRSVLSRRPDYNVLIWIAGLGIVATRVLSLIHRLMRQWLTPERGRSAALAEEGLAIGLLTLWRGAGTAKVSGTFSATLGETWMSPTSRAAPDALPGRLARMARRLKAYWNLAGFNRIKVVIASGILCAGLALMGLIVWGGGYTMIETTEPQLPCSMLHLMGTNDSGEDLLSAVALGGRELIPPLITAILTAVVLGGFLGTIAGLMLGSVTDLFMDLYAELWESIPKLILVLAALTYMNFEHYALKLYMLIGLAFLPLIYRAVRDEVGALRTSLFLEAAVTLGVPRRRILWTHVLRNHALPVVFVEGAVIVGYVLLYDAILGFCGVRQRGEVFTWGSLLGMGVEDFSARNAAGLPTNPLIAWGPFVAILLAIGCSTVVGDSLKSLGRHVRFSQ